MTESVDIPWLEAVTDETEFEIWSGVVAMLGLAVLLARVALVVVVHT
ncbi:hypothetical protein [Bartonella sp. C271]